MDFRRFMPVRVVPRLAFSLCIQGFSHQGGHWPHLHAASGIRLSPDHVWRAKSRTYRSGVRGFIWLPFMNSDQGSPLPVRNRRNCSSMSEHRSVWITAVAPLTTFLLFMCKPSDFVDIFGFVLIPVYHISTWFAFILSRVFTSLCLVSFVIAVFWPVLAWGFGETQKNYRPWQTKINVLVSIAIGRTRNILTATVDRSFLHHCIDDNGYWRSFVFEA